MPPDWLLAVVDVAAIAVVAYLGGLIMQSLGQPRIAGEMAAVFATGLLLGDRSPASCPANRPAAGSPICFRRRRSRSSRSSAGSG